MLDAGGAAVNTEIAARLSDLGVQGGLGPDWGGHGRLAENEALKLRSEG